MRKRHIKRCFFCIVLILFLYLIYMIFFKTTYAESGLLSLDVPDWMRGELPVTSCLTDQAPGPVMEAEKDYYGVFRIRFFDADTQEQITDQVILDQLLSMFVYTDDPFVYDETRSINGTCFFYYNGKLKGGQSAGLFSGFKGRGEGSDVLKGIDAIYMQYSVEAIPGSFSDKLDEVLDEFL